MVTKENAKRPCEPKKMGSLEKFFWAKWSKEPRAVPICVGGISIDAERAIQQAPGKWQPGFTNEGASSHRLSFFFPEKALAGLSQDDIDDLRWESGNTLRGRFLQFIK